MKKFFLALSASTFALSQPAIAQQAADTEDADTIIVTAQKREENILRVPVAITAISGDDLASKGIKRLDDLQTSVPGLSITDAGLTQSFNIRGIGLASTSPNAANGVATYYDGVFQPPIVTTNSFYDIAAVEVLRGPQGTFVGSNSTGGAIFINSRDPKLADLGGYFQGEFGSFKRVAAQAALNLPVGETLAVRAAVNYRTRDSFYTMTTNVRAPGTLNEWGTRIGILWQPSDNFKALIKSEYDEKHTGGYAYRPIIGSRYQAFRTTDIYLLNYDDATAVGFDRNTRNDEQNQQITARLEYKTPGGITLRSVSGYQDKQIRNFYDSDGTNSATLPKNTSDQYVRERVWTQEFNIISPDTGSFRWVVGGYYQKNRILVDITNSPNAPVHTKIDIQNRKITTGIFGQVSFDLSDQFSIDVGARYSNYKVSAFGAVQLIRPAPLAAIFLADPGGAEKDHKLTGKVALNWKPNDDHLFYAFAARGYKSGGLQSPTTTFAPETVMDYEIGWKGKLAGDTLTAQVGAYYYDYKNFQLDAINPVTGVNAVTNLTNAKVKGFEAQLDAKVGGLRLGATLAYNDSSLAGTNFVDTRAVTFAFPGVTAPQCPAGTVQPVPPAAVTCINYAVFTKSTAGGPNLYSPKWTYSLSAEYPFEAGEVTITPRANFGHVGSRYTYIAYDPVRDRIPAYDLLNASIALDYERLGVELWVTNLTKERYITGQQGGANEFYGAPREYGIRLKVDF